ncbi:MAG: hypothetical protein A2498_08660 [Lentisphaerae bacterium RIFOXYC12_FULL_60_16]|nr:MAG: hypothetical protein A2498_08660 [Lentisphaerae bacterium RIFOXYC12_FULL_60_16]OGV77802.1 MAG: hypothetical protein A2340_00920 [Lentisphaerae bacterium RIFOXYB12_FULL_60_10]
MVYRLTAPWDQVHECHCLSGSGPDGRGCFRILERLNMDAKKAERWFPLLLVAVTLVAYSNSFSGPFLFDDRATMVENLTRSDAGWGRLDTRMVVDLTFRLNHAIGGLNPADYHAVNLLIHLMAGLVLYGLIARTLQLPVFAGKYAASGSWLACASALVWMIHPLQTESVTYICQRSESLMGLLFFLTLYALVHGYTSRRQRVWYDVSLAACIVGMGVKEVMGVVPLVAWAYDYCLLGGTVRRPAARWLYHVAMAGAMVILILLWMIQASRVAFDKGAVPIPPATYLLSEFPVILHYLRLSVFPHPLCIDYAWPPVATAGEAAIPGLVLASLGLLTVGAMMRRHPAGFLGVCFFASLAPTSSVVPILDLAFEHRMYVALVAPVVLGVVGLWNAGCWMTRGCRASTALGHVLAVAVIGATFAGLTYRRNRDYYSELDLWRDTVAKRPHNVRAHNNLVLEMMRLGDYVGAEPVARTILARVRESGEPAGPEAWTAIERYHRRVVLDRLGSALLGQKRYPEARVVFEEASASAPGSVPALYNLALAHLLCDDPELAARICETALRLDPGHGGLHALVGTIAGKQGDFPGAVRAYREAVRLSGNAWNYRMELAWLLATCREDSVRDGADAVRLAREACEASGWNSARALETLAAGHAEQGNYSEAVAIQRRALETALRGGDGGAEDRLEEMRRRLAAYGQNRPWREVNP